MGVSRPGEGEPKGKMETSGSQRRGRGHRSPSSSVHPPVLTETWRQERSRVFLVSLDDVVSLA